MMSNYYNNFFRNHERLFRDFERDFGRDSIFPGFGSTFRQDLPMLSWTDDDFFIPRQQTSSGNSQLDSSLRNLNSQFETDYKKLRENYEKQLRQLHDQHRPQQQAAGESNQQQQQQQQAAGENMEVEQNRQQQRLPHQEYQYSFSSNRVYKDGRETGETIEKKEKLVNGKKVLETKITKYNPDGTKDVQEITEDEQGKREKKLRLDDKNQPLQLTQ